MVHAQKVEVGADRTVNIAKSVDMLDAKTKNSICRGTATDTLDHGPTGNMQKDAKSVEKKIKKAEEKMFKKFPVAN
jgi:hypothetical protein